MDQDAEAVRGDYGIRRDWAPEGRAAYLRDAVAAADPEVDFSQYDIVYFIADPDAPGVDSDATKVVNFDRPISADGTQLRRIVTVFEKHPPDRNVLAHETGHVFDLPDLYHRPTDGKGDWDTYVGDWDVMGSQFGMSPDLFAWQKWKLGWLDASQVDCVPSGSSLHTLQPLSATPLRGGTGGTRLAVVRTGSGSAIAVEARGSAGNDGETCTEGVLVYRVRNEAASGAARSRSWTRIRTPRRAGTGRCTRRWRTRRWRWGRRSRCRASGSPSRWRTGRSRARTR